MSDAVQAYYDQLANDYDEDRFGGSYGQFIHRQEKRLLQNWGISSLDGTVLSLGCGTGRLMEYATHGIDISPQMLAVAQQKFPQKDFVEGDAMKCPFPDQSFNGIFSLHVMMHLDPQKVGAIVREAHRLLEPGGIFVFDVPSAPRRRITGHQQKDWHGNNAFTQAMVKELLAKDWELEQIQGILFLPLHRIPRALRKSCFFIDRLLCQSPCWPYASYWMIKARKR